MINLALKSYCLRCKYVGTNLTPKPSTMDPSYSICLPSNNMIKKIGLNECSITTSNDMILMTCYKLSKGIHDISVVLKGIYYIYHTAGFMLYFFFRGTNKTLFFYLSYMPEFNNQHTIPTY